MKVISDYKINITAAPNSAYEAITQLVTKEQAGEYDLSHVTHLINGSEFVDNNTVNRFCELFDIIPDSFTPGYGLSECVCVACAASRDYRYLNIDPDEYRQGRFIPAETGKTVVSVGSVAGNTKVRTVRKDGTLCGENEIGELYLQGETICAGYFRNEEETKRFHAKIVGEKGDFFSTGDMGYVHEGRIYLTGRIKEMIIVAGKNLFPDDIISHISTAANLPKASMAVFSILHEGAESPVLCCDASVSGEENFRNLTGIINKTVSDAMGFAFRDIVFVSPGTLPRTDNRKIKTLDTKRRYKEKLLNVVYSLQQEGIVSENSSDMSKFLEDIPDISRDSTIDEIKNVIRNLYKKMLPGVEFSDDSSFLELGADSLTMTRLVTMMEQKSGMPLDLRKLIDDPSINGISGFIYQKLKGVEEKSQNLLYGECILPEEIVLEGEYDKAPEDCKNIFLTGSTGFLGAYTIKALIEEHGKRGLKIYCHGRAASREDLVRRLSDNLKKFNCYKAEYMDYLVPVLGNLLSPKLGMDKESFEKLSQECDMVIHNGAVLNFLLSYAKLRDANVLGTREALRFAMAGRPKYFEYISSYSVYDNPSFFKKTVSEDDTMESADGYFLGYSETKWVSEKLVQIAAKRGLKTVVYRPGDITGTREDGIWKLEDLISRSIVGCIQMQAVPDMDVHLHLTPVDYVAACISHISFKKESIGHGFNIINKFIKPMKDIIKLMGICGYKARILPYEEWCNVLTNTKPEENVLRVLSCLFTDKKPEGEALHERYGSYQADFSTENCDRLMADSGVTCPPMDKNLLVAYLKNFHRAGYIPRPRGFFGRLLG